jgi:hypothetical protein
VKFSIRVLYKNLWSSYEFPKDQLSERHFIEGVTEIFLYFLHFFMWIKFSKEEVNKNLSNNFESCENWHNGSCT